MSDCDVMVTVAKMKITLDTLRLRTRSIFRLVVVAAVAVVVVVVVVVVAAAAVVVSEAIDIVYYRNCTYMNHN